MKYALIIASLTAVAGCVVIPPPPPPPVPRAPPAPAVSATPERVATSVPIEVLKPDGAGPFPAVVMLHDCSGLGPRSSGAPRRWARELVSQGYVVAIPDSFSTRGHAGGVCTSSSPTRNDVAPGRRVYDAYEALDHVRGLPYVDARHVGVMGGSHGGATTLATVGVFPRDPEGLAGRKRQGFVAAIALYPNCSAANSAGSGFKPVAPLLMLSGELDDWTPAAPCVRLAHAATAAGYPVRAKVYPGAHHSFDSASPIRYVEARNNMNSPTGHGATTGGNPEAWADSRREVTAFFAQHLKGRS